MKKTIFMSALCSIIAFTANLEAKKTTYIVTNQRFDYVKLSEISLREAEVRGVSHPIQVDQEKIRKALASLQFGREGLWKKSATKERRLLSDEALDFLSFNLAKAFQQAKTTEEVIFSYLDQDPIVILRNDRLTIASTWVHGNKLHLRFKKLYAKITGDIDKRGNEAKAAAQAKGIRIALQVKPGQQLSPNDENEIVVDLDYDFSALSSSEEEDEGEKKEEKRGEKELSKEESLKDTTIKERLEKLEELKKSGLISKKEYNEKRKEILRDL